MSDADGKRPLTGPPALPGSGGGPGKPPVKLGNVFGTAELDFFTAGESIESGAIALEPLTEVRWHTSLYDRLRVALRQVPGGRRGRAALGVGAGTLVVLVIWATTGTGPTPPAATAAAERARASDVPSPPPAAPAREKNGERSEETRGAPTPPPIAKSPRPQPARATTIGAPRPGAKRKATAASARAKTTPPPVEMGRSAGVSAGSSRWSSPRAAKSSHPRLDLGGRWGRRR